MCSKRDSGLRLPLWVWVDFLKAAVFRSEPLSCSRFKINRKHHPHNREVDA